MKNRLFAFCVGCCLLAATVSSYASTVTPSDNTAGVSTSYSVTFTLGALDNLPNNGQITITFGSPLYNLTGTLSATSPDISGGFLNATPGGGQSVTFVRDGLGTPLTGGVQYTIVFQSVTNPTITGSSYSLTVTTLGGVVPTSDPSANFTISPAALGSFTVSGAPASTTAGQAFSSPANDITVTALDIFANQKTNYAGTVSWASSDAGATVPTSGLTFSGATKVFSGTGFTLQTTGNQTFTVSDGAATGATGNIAVQPAALDHFTMSGVPGSATAGVAFSSPANDIIVTAFDQFNNQKTNYTGTVTWSSSDLSATLPLSGLTFSGASKTFPGTSFTLRTAGSRTLTVQDGAVSLTSSAVTVSAADIATLTLSNPAAQEAGVGFALSVSGAQDAFGNDASGAVVVSFADIDPHGVPNGETPVLTNISVTGGSGNASQLLYLRENNVQLRGTVAVTAATDDTQPFNVAAGDIENFSFRDPGTQTAGTGFTLFVENARDGFNNQADGTVTVSFVGGGNHDAPDGTTPTLRPVSVVNGSGSNTQDLFKAETGVQLAGSVAATGASDNTQTFDVDAAGINSLVVDSPGNQTAGAGFSISVSSVQDVYQNPTSGTIQISFTDGQAHAAPNSITPTLRDIIATSGSGSANQLLVLAENNVRFRGTGNGNTDDSPTFDVAAATLDELQIQTGTTGNTSELGNQSLSTGSALSMHASGFDIYQNYRGNETVTWSLVGTTIGTLSPSSGTNTTLDATTPGTALVQALHSGSGKTDQTGAIDVSLGNVDRVEIRTAANNGGKAFGDTTLTTDQTMTFWAAGFDDQNNYVDDTAVNWSSNGTLEAVSSSAKSLTFEPTSTGSGQIVASHATATGDQTGTVTVSPGLPSGAVTLTPVPTTLAPAQTATITSSQIQDAELNPVGAGVEFDVSLTSGPFGSISTADANAGKAGHQVATNASSLLVFDFLAGSTGGTQNISVTSVGGANGNTAINVGSLEILSIANAPDFVSLGQQGVANVQMTVRNLSASPVTNLDPVLTFSGTGFTAVRTDVFTDIPASPGTRTFTFTVDVGASADLGAITIDGQINGDVSGVSVSAQGATTTDSWTVQNAAQVRGDNVATLPDTVAQGQQGIDFTVTVSNPATAGLSAAAVIDNISLKFTLIKDGSDQTSEFVVSANPANPTSVAAGASANFDFTVNVLASADSGRYSLDASVLAHDLNGPALVVQDNAVTTPDQWFVKGAANMQILSLTPVPSAARAGQTTPWRVRMRVTNGSPDAVAADFNSANTYVRFRIGADDVTGEYTITKPDSFKVSGTSRLESGASDTLDFVITQTGTTTGTATISGSLEAVIVGSGGSRITDDTSDDVGLGSVQINSATAAVTITSTSPHDSTPNASPTQARVNTNQSFTITVSIDNDLAEPVENVIVQLTSSIPIGGSTIITPQQSIALIAADDRGSIDFALTAPSTSNPVTGETFAATVLSATGQQSRQAAPIGTPDPGDDFVLFRVDEPANLSVGITVDTVQTATDTFQVQALVTNLGEASVGATGQLTLTLPLSGYTLIFGDNPALFTPGIVVSWDVRAPATETGLEAFTATLTTTPNDENIGTPAAVSKSADSQQVRTSNIGLTIDAFRVVSPPGALDDTLSSAQEFRVQADITRTANIDRVDATLSPPPGIDFKSGPISQTKELEFGVTTVTWDLIITDQTRDDQTVTVDMVGFDSNERQIVQTSNALTVFVVAKANLDFESFQAGGLLNNNAPVNHEFPLTARIVNVGGAGVGQGEITLDLGSSGITIVDEGQQPAVRQFALGDASSIEVTWDVRSSTVPIASASVRASVSTPPQDENSGQAAPFSGEVVSRAFAIETVAEGGVAISGISVTSPTGAQNGVLSNGQEFVLDVAVSSVNLDPIEATLDDNGAGYVVLDGNRTKPVVSGGVNWRLRAPPNAQPAHFIRINVSGDDASSGERKTALPDSIQFQIVRRAALDLTASITEPPSATDQILTVGQVFTLTADLRNTGEAAFIGQDDLKITLPVRYSTGEPLIKSVSPGGQVTWQITAPSQATNQLENIVVSVDAQIAIDENSGLPPPSTPSDVTVQVQTQAVGLNVVMLAARKPVTVPRGASNIALFGLEFRNSSDDNIDLERIDLTVEDNQGSDIAPNSLLTALRVVDYGDENTVIPTSASPGASNPVQVDFIPPLTVPKNDSVLVEFRVDLVSSSEAPNFRLTINSPGDDVFARNTASDSLVAILDDSGFPLNAPLTAGASAIIGSDFQASFFNFPNPFGRGETTTFNYTLPQDSDGTLRIYTLLGELVRTKSFSSSEERGFAGNHDGAGRATLDWDGRNGSGQEVLNGVYVAVLTTSAGKAVTKIAIAK